MAIFLNKILFFIIFFTTVSFGTHQIILTDSIINNQSSNKSLIYEDINSTFTVQDINQQLQLFKQNTNANQGFTSSSIWIMFEIINQSSTAQSLILQNNYAFIREIDVLIIKSNSSKFHKLGSTRGQSLREILHYHPIVPLVLEKNEKAQIFIKHKSISIVNVNWEISKANQFVTNTYKESIFLGFIFGILVALITYNFNLFLSLKDKPYLYYSIHGIATLLVQAILHGVVYSFDLGFDNFIIMNLIMLMPCISIIMINMFILDFFDLSKKHPKLATLLKVINILELLIFITNLGRFFDYQYVFSVENQIRIMFVFYLLMTIVSGYIATKKYIGSNQFFIGSTSYSAFMVIGLLYTSGKIESNNILALSTLIGVLLDMVFISLALSKKIEVIKQEKELGQKVLLEHSKILQINSVVSHIVHQLKSPIIHLGGISANITMLFEKYHKIISNDDKLIAKDLDKIVSNMDNLIMKFKDLYKKSTKPEYFDLKFCIENSLELFSNRIISKGIFVTTNLIDIKLLNYDEALTHTLNAIIENSIDIFEERKIKNKKLKFDSFLKEKHVVITIEDNAGGIAAKPIDTIFQIYYSQKQQQSSGLGLALSKNLIEDKMGGTIKVANKNDGAIFTICLPIKSSRN